jgi:uroporphyrinogen-III synthase
MRRILVLRPEPGATATMDRARDLELDAISIPLFEIVPVRWTAPEPKRVDALLLTSANALRHGGGELGKLLDLPVYAVGEATADAARKAGFRIAVVGDADVDGLVGSIAADMRLLHLCGEEREEPSELRHSITPVTVYGAREIREPDLGAFREGVALIHSPRAGRRFAELVQDRGGIAIAAISASAAGTVGAGWEVVEAATAPNDDALLALAARLCNKPATE